MHVVLLFVFPHSSINIGITINNCTVQRRPNWHVQQAGSVGRNIYLPINQTAESWPSCSFKIATTETKYDGVSTLAQPQPLTELVSYNDRTFFFFLSFLWVKTTTRQRPISKQQNLPWYYYYYCRRTNVTNTAGFSDRFFVTEQQYRAEVHTRMATTWRKKWKEKMENKIGKKKKRKKRKERNGKNTPGICLARSMASFVSSWLSTMGGIESRIQTKKMLVPSLHTQSTNSIRTANKLERYKYQV